MRTPVMLGVLAALVFVSGPARTATGEVRGGTIRIGMDADMTTMDRQRSRAAVEKYGEDYARNPVGTGPFRFVEWVKDDHLTLKRFDGYWDASLPHLDEIVYRPVPDHSVRFAAMRTGQIDVMHQIAPKDVAAARAERGLKVSEI